LGVTTFIAGVTASAPAAISHPLVSIYSLRRFVTFGFTPPRVGGGGGGGQLFTPGALPLLVAYLGKTKVESRRGPKRKIACSIPILTFCEYEYINLAHMYVFVSYTR